MLWQGLILEPDFMVTELAGDPTTSVEYYYGTDDTIIKSPLHMATPTLRK